MKLIVDISDNLYNVIKLDKYGLHKGKMYDIIRSGIPLDDVKAAIEQTAKDYDQFDDYRRTRGLWIALHMLDNIGKESEDKPNE